MLTYETLANRANRSTTGNVGTGLVSGELLNPCAQVGRSLQKLVN